MKTDTDIDDLSAISPAVRGGGERQQRLRLRAAWMYFIEERTQSDIAERLGVGRVTVVRLLAEARERREVRIWIDGTGSDLVSLERGLEERFGLAEAMVVPTPDRAEQVAAAVGAGAGRMISGLLAEGMSVGVGWGDTLMQTLGALEGRPIPSLSVVSLLGGVSRAKRSNPSEFAWRFASLFDGDCALVAAPAIVDSAETRRVLIERCGVGEVFARASALDLAVVSVATPAADATSFRFGFFSEAERAELVERGAVGDVLFHFFDRHGQTIDHPVHDRIISAPLAAITGARQRLLISGGLGKLAAIRGAIALLSPTLLVTDEAVAAALLGRPAAPQRG